MTLASDDEQRMNSMESIQGDTDSKLNLNILQNMKKNSEMSLLKNMPAEFSKTSGRPVPKKRLTVKFNEAEIAE